MRIVSLLPSATDIVCALGAADALVGVSHSCGDDWDALPRLTSTRIDLDQSSASIDRQVKTAIGPLYDLDVDMLQRLAPDVVVSQSLCDVCAVPSGDVVKAIQTLPSQPKLVNLEPFRLADVPRGFSEVGQAIGRPAAARALVSRWQATLKRHEGRFVGDPMKIAFLDWLAPPFAAGHWVPDIIELIGCESVLAKPGQPSREITWHSIRQSAPDFVIAACCGYAKRRAEDDSTPEDVPVHLLDGYDRFSRPSPKLLDSVDELVDFLDSRIIGKPGVSH